MISYIKIKRNITDIKEKIDNVNKKKTPRGNVDIKIEIQNIKEKFRNFQDIEKRGDNVDILDIKEGFYVK